MKSAKNNYPIIFMNGLFLGMSINECAAKALAIAKKDNVLVRFVFNDVIVNVTANMTPQQVVENYGKRQDYEYNVHINSEKGRKEQLNYKLKSLKRERKNKETLAYIANEKFETNYDLLWNDFKSRNQDPYGAAIVRYAENWAKLMQKELKSGAALTKEMVEKKRIDADVEGVTGNMDHYATYLLIDAWLYGAKMGLLLGVEKAAIIKRRRNVAQKNAQIAKAIEGFHGRWR